MTNTVGVVAASLKLSVPGMVASMADGEHTTVPRQPCARPNTASPAREGEWSGFINRHAYDCVAAKRSDDEEYHMDHDLPAVVTLIIRPATGRIPSPDVVHCPCTDLT